MNNTIFDDVFRTMIEKMPYLAVPLINEVFHTSYPEDVKIIQLRNEHQQKSIISEKFRKYAGSFGNRCDFPGWKYIFIFHTDYKNV